MHSSRGFPYISYPFGHARVFCFYYKTPSEKKLRCQLHESLRSMDPAFVKRAIDQFCKSGLEDSGETQQARDRLVYLKLSKGLYVD